MSDEDQATCGDCGSDMTPVRPGKWQCDVCESRDFVRREQAKALRWASRQRGMGNCDGWCCDILRELADKVECCEIEVTP